MEKIRMNVAIKASSKTVYNALTAEKGLSGWRAKQTIAGWEIGFLNTFTFGTFDNKIRVIELTLDKKVVWECVESIDEWVALLFRLSWKIRAKKRLFGFHMTVGRQ